MVMPIKRRCNYCGGEYESSDCIDISNNDCPYCGGMEAALEVIRKEHEEKCDADS